MANQPPTTASTNSNKLVEASYDKMASQYLSWTLSTPSPRISYLSTLLTHLPNPSTSRILELGCGAGVPGTQFLAQSCSHVTGIDISSTQINLAKQHVKETNTEFVQSDMLALKFEKGSFDAVVGLYSILHLTREDQVVLMDMIKGWLKPGGWFVGNFSLGAKEINAIWIGGQEMFWAGWQRGEWIAKMRSAGWEVEKEDVVVDVEDGREVRFLWVVARTKE